MYKSYRLLIILVLLLTACSGTQAGDDEVLTLGITTNLAFFQAEIYRCSAVLSEHILVKSQPMLSLSPQEYPAIFHAGEPPPGSIFSTAVGSLSLRVILNSSNPISQLENGVIEQILLGILIDWQAAAPEFFTVPTPIKVWTYPQGDDIRGLLEDTVLNGRTLTALANPAPDVSGMLAAVQEDPAAIGYIVGDGSSSNTDGSQTSVKTLLQMETTIVASFPALPGENLKQLVVCLQENMELIQ